MNYLGMQFVIFFFFFLEFSVFNASLCPYLKNAFRDCIGSTFDIPWIKKLFLKAVFCTWREVEEKFIVF